MFRKLLSLTLLVCGIAQAQIPISGLPNATTPLGSSDKIIVNQPISSTVYSTRQAPLSALSPFFPSLTSHYLLQAPDATLTQSRVLAGTANEIILTDGGALGNLVLSTPQPIGFGSTPTFAGLTLTGGFLGTSGTFSGALSSSGYTGTTGSFSSTLSSSGYTGTTGSFSGALSAGSFSVTTPIPATSGGTGFGSYAIGDLLSASTTTALSKISDVAAGSYLRSGGVSTLPLWSTLTLPNAATTGDLLMATGTNAVGSRADVAAGSYLRSAGVGAVPVYSTTTIPNTAVLGDIWYGSAANAISALAGNITATKQFLTQTGTGTVSAAPVWGAIAAADLPGSFAGFANPTGTIGLTAVNGAATTAPRSDSAPALSQAISPTWTGTHLFEGAVTTSVAASSLSLGVNSALPELQWTATGAAVDNRVWDMFADASAVFHCRVINDAHASSADWCTVARSGVAVSSIKFPSPVIVNATGNTGDAFQSTGGTSTYGARILSGGGSSGTEFGLRVTAGTTASDIAVSVQNLAASLVFFQIDGAGTVVFPQLVATSSAQAGTMCVNASKQINYDTTTTCLLSARRYKQDIEDLDVGLSKVMKLRPVSYNLRPEYNPDHLGPQVGLIAEEVGEVDPRLEGMTADGKQAQGVRYLQMTALLVKAIQQQQYEIYSLWAALALSVGFTVYRTRKHN